MIMEPLRAVWAWFTTESTEPVSVQPVPESAVSARVVIHYADETFIPRIVEVPVGETIAFVNDGDGYLWPASDPHPTHTVEPAFDALRAVTKEKPWSFTFDKQGTWTFHNHLSPTATGTIIVR